MQVHGEQNESDAPNGTDPPNGTSLSNGTSPRKGTSSPKGTSDEEVGAFQNFDIPDEMVEILQYMGIKYLFPIQASTFNFVASGEDVIAQARTGTGKTLSFALPLAIKLQKKDKAPKVGRKPRVLVMAPTRELARQVADNFQSLLDNLVVLCIYGGTPYGPQEYQLRQGVDVVVGTPGRIQDMIEKEKLDLGRIKHVVLDEVDQMLDMGFHEKVDEILQNVYKKEKESRQPQTLLFSATLPHWVHQTAQKYMSKNVQKVDLTSGQVNRTATTVEHLAIKCNYQDLASTLGAVVLVYSGMHGRAMVFCKTKRDADELSMSPEIKSEARVLHGDIPQDKREMILEGFKSGKCKVLVTTDVSARGLDIPEVDLVIQCSPPHDVDAYIHRSGRTGRAGRSGVSVCFYKPRDSHAIQQVEQKAGIKFRRVGPPTPEDIIKASAKDVARSLEKVTSETLEHFRAEAAALIAERGAEEALASALAVISGSMNIVSRSLLCSKEGFTTYLYRTKTEMRGTGYVWSQLEQRLPGLKDKVLGMRLCKDKYGACFDLPSELEEAVASTWQDKPYDSLTKAKELPELVEYDNNYGFQGGRGNFGGGRGRGGRGHGNFGGRSRGFQGRGRGNFQNGGSGRNGHQNGFGGVKRKFDGNSSNGASKRGKF